MNKRIPVKFGIEIILMVLLIAVLMIKAVTENPEPFIIIVTILTMFLLVFSIFGIRYEIKDEKLIITYNFFWKTEITIEEIFKIEKTWNLIASPAPSFFGRVEIYFPGNSIVISPKNFEEFKKELLKINPKITVKN